MRRNTFFKKVITTMLTGTLLMTGMTIPAAADEAIDEGLMDPIVIMGDEPSEYGYIDMELPIEPAQDSGAAAAFYDDLNQTAVMPSAFGEFDWSSIFSEFAGVDVQTPEVAVQGPIRNQWPCGMCWTFSAAASAESYVRRHYGLAAELNLSELQIGYYSYFRNASSQPEGCQNDIFEWPGGCNPNSSQSFCQQGGNDTLAVGTLGMGVGFTDESTVPYGSIISGLSADLTSGSLASSANTYILKNALYTTGTDVDRVKELLVQNGAVSASVYYDTDHINLEKYTLGAAVAGSKSNHAITIVGWYDDFPKEYFREYVASSTGSPQCVEPSSNGAWLIQNSHGLNYYNNQGYFWASYEDGTIRAKSVVSYEAEPVADAYDHIYQYDGGTGNGRLTANFKPLSNSAVCRGMANVFTSVQNEELGAVSFFSLNQDLDYTLSIYTGVDSSPADGVLAEQITGHLTYAGLNRITLNTPISLTEGEKYAVCVEFLESQQAYLVMENPTFYNFSNGYVGSCGINAGESFYELNGGFGDNWYDNANQSGYYNWRIKAYTNDADHEHVYGEPRITKEASCEEGGLQVYTCEICGLQKEEEIPALGHDMTVVPGTPSDCTHDGVTEKQVCSRCDYSEGGEVIPALGHDYQASRVEDPMPANTVQLKYVCSRCQDTTTTSADLYQGNDKYDRIYGQSRIETSVNVADKLRNLLGKEQLGQENRFDTVVLASSQTFPDALAGSYLAAQKLAPMLLIKGSDPDDTLNYLYNNMSLNGTIYILGGTSAIPESVVDSLKNHGFANIVRLAGSNRYATNLEILKETGTVGQSELVICSGNGFADSLSASSAGRPILIVNTSLKDEQKNWLNNNHFDKYVILGGTAAVSEEVRQYIMTSCAGGDSKRIKELSGSNRYETSALAAGYFFKNAKRALLAVGSNFPDGLSGGAYAYLLNCPVLLANQGHVNEPKAYASDKDRTYCVTLGGPGIIRDEDMKNIYP